MEQATDRNKYDVVSISQPGQAKRANTIRHALVIDGAKLKRPGEFIKIFSDMFLTKEAGANSYK